MTTMRTSTARRSTHPSRRAVVALLAGAGVVLTPLTAQTAAAAPPAATVQSAPVAAPNAAAQTVVNTALAQQGKPYVWAGAGPNSFDCSGLTQFAFRAAGVNLPHSSRMQATMGTPVARGDLRPGDLIAFYSPVGHVGIYIGNGQMVHAPTRGSVVKVVNIDVMPGYNTARRLV
jgi:cell wall-associated NlpC family hydrolase